MGTSTYVISKPLFERTRTGRSTFSGFDKQQTILSVIPQCGSGGAAPDPLFARTLFTTSGKIFKLFIQII